MGALWNDLGVYVSVNREGTLGTGIATARRLSLSADYQPVADAVELADDAGNTIGTEGPKRTAILTRRAGVALPWNFVGPDEMAWCLAYTLGEPSTAAADTSAYAHTFAAAASRTLRTFTLEEYLASGVQKKFPSGMIADWSLRVQRQQLATMRANVVFAGTKAAGTGTGSFISGEPVFRGKGLAAYIGTAYDGSPALGGADLSSPTTLTALVTDIDMGITNIRNMGGLYTFAGDTIARAERGPRAYSLGLTLEVADHTYMDLIPAQTTKALAIEWDSGVLAGTATQNYAWKIVFPACVFESVGSSWDADGRLRQAFRVRILEDATYGRIQAVVWNKTATYAAAA